MSVLWMWRLQFLNLFKTSNFPFKAQTFHSFSLQFPLFTFDFSTIFLIQAKTAACNKEGIHSRTDTGTQSNWPGLKRERVTCACRNMSMEFPSVAEREICQNPDKIQWQILKLTLCNKSLLHYQQYVDIKFAKKEFLLYTTVCYTSEFLGYFNLLHWFFKKTFWVGRHELLCPFHN